MTLRILYAWELGGGAGHVMRMRPIAEELRARNAHVTPAVRNLAAGRPLADAGFNIVQAPGITRKPNNKLLAFNYAEILIRAGYGSADHLRTTIAAWHGLIAACRADLVVADFAPGALLGACFAGIPAATVGTGFALPPCGTPLPSIRPGQTPPPGRPQQSEADIFSMISAALAANHISPAPDLASYFNTGRDILCTFRELDHADRRENEMSYAGPVFSSPPPGTASSEPATHEVFAYLDGGAPSFEAVMTSLAETGAQTLTVVRGRPRVNLRALIAPNIRIASDAVNVPHALHTAKAVVCHGGMGLVSQALLAGVPLVINPQNPEQGGTAHRVATLGAGAIVSGPLNIGEISNTILDAKRNPRMANAAGAFAERYRGYNVAVAVSGIADRLLGPT